MSNLKTQVSDKSVTNFLNSLENEQRKKDSFELLKVFKNATGLTPKIWGESIIGYGQYHYKSDRSAQEGDWPLTGFSPRKQALTIYIMPGFNEYTQLLEKIGKYKSSVSCLYIKKLSDINPNILEKLIKESVTQMKKIHNVK